MSRQSRQEVASLVTRYIECFNRADFDAALECYFLPFTWFFGSKSVTVSTRDEFLAMMQQTRDSLLRDGLKASELESVTVRMLGDTIALAAVVVTRQKTDGTPLARVSGSYFVHRSRDGWKLVANGMHPIEAIVPEQDV